MTYYLYSAMKLEDGFTLIHYILKNYVFQEYSIKDHNQINIINKFLFSLYGNIFRIKPAKIDVKGRKISPRLTLKMVCAFAI